MILTSFLTHSMALQGAALRAGVHASIRLADYSLHLEQCGMPAVWHPKFLARLGNQLAYTDAAGPTTIGFAGWLPYRLRRWPEAVDKLAFKALADRQGVATPAACGNPAQIGGPFLVKHRNGSFGDGQRGPFLSHDAADPLHHLADGEYYENFLVGHIAKAWCWGAACVALELQQPPTVTGDGVGSLRALAGGPGVDTGTDWALVARLAAYCGVADLDTVLARGKEVLVDYRYGSRLADRLRPSHNALEDSRASGLAAQFEQAAQRLQACIPTHLAPSLYTLDAIVDSEGRAWFLEMNCNPVTHPRAYGSMLSSTFGIGAAADAETAPAWEDLHAI